jgi:hypothetical protein
MASTRRAANASKAGYVIRIFIRRAKMGFVSQGGNAIGIPGFLLIG